MRRPWPRRITGPAWSRSATKRTTSCAARSNSSARRKRTFSARAKLLPAGQGIDDGQRGFSSARFVHVECYMLQIEHLTKIYDNGVHALKDVSFEVPDGQFLVIIGLSGSGKSTLLRCINRLIEPTDGRILWNGIDITAATDEELRLIRRRIGMIFQHFNLVRRSSVITNVLAGRLGYTNPAWSLLNHFSHADKQKALEKLDRVGIRDKAYIRADQLSGGQQDRKSVV